MFKKILKERLLTAALIISTALAAPPIPGQTQIKISIPGRIRLRRSTSGVSVCRAP